MTIGEPPPDHEVDAFTLNFTASLTKELQIPQDGILRLNISFGDSRVFFSVLEIYVNAVDALQSRVSVSNINFLCLSELVIIYKDYFIYRSYLVKRCFYR